MPEKARLPLALSVHRPGVRSRKPCRYSPVVAPAGETSVGLERSTWRSRYRHIGSVAAGLYCFRVAAWRACIPRTRKSGVAISESSCTFLEVGTEFVRVDRGNAR